ncbi:uncharacterized protein LOC130720325 [Lotus japonicus]|uniref:uncharacterized protein LOC130720325 n=1 Tax=Lotus japonicus TaxID=34305 RepID=UPI002589435A|nr:uncharacterized protein LOC130720325 [Lotus japonicus]XP_057426938.1 uncharacterized protein LOC130720325 [Lotus japonicus]
MAKTLSLRFLLPWEPLLFPSSRVPLHVSSSRLQTFQVRSPLWFHLVSANASGSDRFDHLVSANASGSGRLDHLVSPNASGSDRFDLLVSANASGLATKRLGFSQTVPILILRVWILCLLAALSSSPRTQFNVMPRFKRFHNPQKSAPGSLVEASSQSIEASSQSAPEVSQKAPPSKNPVTTPSWNVEAIGTHLVLAINSYK